MIIETLQRLMDANLAGLATDLTLTDIGALIGMFSALLSTIGNLLYTWRKDRREQRDSDAAWARFARAPTGAGFADPVSQQALMLTAPFYRDF